MKNLMNLTLWLINFSVFSDHDQVQPLMPISHVRLYSN
ncbi:hypothetical protein ACJW30_12G013500 [Castanea mollissima]